MSFHPADTHPTACFSVQAAPDCSVLPRVLELFSKRGLMPTRLMSDVGVSRPDMLTIDIQAEGVEPGVAAYMARCMRQLAYVDCVLTSEKAAAARYA